MNSNQQKINLTCGNERRIFRRDDSITLELEYLREQLLQTTCQEIADLYTMLRHKCMQGEGLLEFAQYPDLQTQSH